MAGRVHVVVSSDFRMIEWISRACVNHWAAGILGLRLFLLLVHQLLRTAPSNENTSILWCYGPPMTNECLTNGTKIHKSFSLWFDTSDDFWIEKSRIKMFRTRTILRTPSRNFFSTSAKAQGAKATTPTQSTSNPSSEKKKKRLVVAVGGNALQRRGDRLTIENMLVRNFCSHFCVWWMQLEYYTVLVDRLYALYWTTLNISFILPKWHALIFLFMFSIRNWHALTESCG